MNEKEWIKNLKVGDEVIVVSRGCGGTERISKIDRITPKGFLSIGGDLFKLNGNLRGQSWKWLREPTKENKLKIQQRGTIRKCFQTMDKVVDVTYEQAVKILEILEVQNEPSQSTRKD